MCYVFYLDSFVASSRNQLKVARKKKKREMELSLSDIEDLMEPNSRNIARSEEETEETQNSLSISDLCLSLHDLYASLCSPSFFASQSTW